MAGLMQAIRAAGAHPPLVSVVVDPDDATLDRLRDEVKPDLIQLHGQETPQRTADISAHTGLPLIKVISVAAAADLDMAPSYEPYAQYLMFDAKTPKDAAMPGGLGIAFDWSLMRGYRGQKPWFLAGGLTPETIAEAARQSGATLIDVSSGVESAPGVKSLEKISRFLNAVKSL